MFFCSFASVLLKRNVMTTKKKTLTLKEKIDVISYHEKHPKLTSRAIATNFGVGRIQIQNILKRKNELKTECEENQPSTRKCRHRTTENDDINRLTWEWFKDVVSRKLPVTKPMLQERAKCFAEQLEVDTIKLKDPMVGLKAFESVTTLHSRLVVENVLMYRTMW